MYIETFGSSIMHQAIYKKFSMLTIVKHSFLSQNKQKRKALPQDKYGNKNSKD